MTKVKDKFLKQKLRSSYVTTIISMSLVLFMLGLFGLVLLTSEKLSVFVKENIGFSVYIKGNAKEVDVFHLKKILDASRYVKTTKYISKEDAARILKQDLDPNEDFVTFLDGTNPLPASIDVQLKAEYANNDSIKWIEKEILQNENVKEVFYLKSLVHLIDENVKKIGMILIGISILLLLISFVLISNTIRLSVYSKRFLIRTMQLVGATRAYIRKPFLIQSVIQGVISSFIAIILLTVLVYEAGKQIPDIYGVQDIQIYAILFISVLALGILISLLSTFLGINKYLNMKVDNLYVF